MTRGQAQLDSRSHGGSRGCEGRVQGELVANEKGELVTSGVCELEAIRVSDRDGRALGEREGWSRDGLGGGSQVERDGIVGRAPASLDRDGGVSGREG